MTNHQGPPGPQVGHRLGPQAEDTRVIKELGYGAGNGYLRSGNHVRLRVYGLVRIQLLKWQPPLMMRLL
ncbi:hypothetical protein NC651_029287 [Populus alba x Populus x berolinensis]|nr:hypothetical protein NC651_029287 [Populus alba x Populus x berolinensis]